MINFDDYVNENKTEHNKNWPYIPGHSCRILIIGDSGSGKTNVLLNLIENQPDIICMLKIRMKQNINISLIKEKRWHRAFYDPKAFIEYSNNMHYVYKNTD